MHASPLPIHGKSRMRKRACTDLCGGRSAMVVPTATVIWGWLTAISNGKSASRRPTFVKGLAFLGTDCFQEVADAKPSIGGETSADR